MPRAIKRQIHEPVHVFDLRMLARYVKSAFKLVPHLKHVNLSISTSDQMITHKFKGKLDHKSVIKEMSDAVKEAVRLGVESIGVNAEDASRTKIDYLTEFALSAKAAG